MTTHTVIGQPIGQIDGPQKVTGVTAYGVDMTMPGALWLRLLRSPYPSARIVRVDVAKALAVPGVRAVLTGDDVRGMRTGVTYKDEPVLAWDVVRFAGEKVAAVTADDEETAARALALIEVEYEPLPALFDAREAALPDAKILHPEFSGYVDVEQLPVPSNVYCHKVQDAGDLEAGFAEADVIVEQTYETPRSHQLYMEPHACLVAIDADGVAQVWATCQGPSANRDEVARVLGLRQDQVVFNVCELGGSYGGKTDATGVVLCYLLAKETGHPVKFVMDYAEELTAMNPRHPSSITIRAGVKRDGTLTAWHAKLYFATGAYAAYAPVPASGGLPVTYASGPYKTPNARIDSYQVYTNTVPCGWYRGPGSFQSVFACESHMDLIAAKLRMDPVELRLRNIIHDGGEMPIRRSWQPAASPDDPDYQPVRLEETLRAALSAAGYYETKTDGVGRGIALSYHGQLGGTAHAVVRVHPDGHVAANVSTFAPGMGTYTIVAQVVAEELGVPVEAIEVRPWSTAEGPGDDGVAGDRGARVTTQAVHQACEDLKQRVRDLAGEVLGWADEILAFEGGAVSAANGERIRLHELAARIEEPLMGRGDVDEPFSGSPYTSFVAHIAEVAVDRETGHARLVRYTAAHETGVVLNPLGFHGQINGGVVHGVGQTFMEELPIVDGAVSTTSLLDYKIPTVADAPDLRTVILDSATGHGPYKVRGIGNNSISLVAPAVANAIADACGARLVSLPITAEAIYRTLREQDAHSAAAP
jgi:CO/xanthine dehydrogenase Mo-binding subunit